MSALAWLQTIVAVRARGSSSCHFGAPLVLRPDGGVEIVEPDGSAVVVTPANVAAYPRAVPSTGFIRMPDARSGSTVRTETWPVDSTTESTGGEATPPAEGGGLTGDATSTPVDPRRDKGRR